MKKTTYILASAITLLLIFCFLLPVILFKTNESITETTIFLKHSPGEAGKEIVLPGFSKLVDLGSESYSVSICDSLGQLIKPSITIEESDSVSSPVLRVNPIWNNLVEADTVPQVGLIRINAHLPKNTYAHVIVPENETEIAVLTMPRGMLKEIIESNILVKLSDFKDADLSLYRNQRVTAENCTFSNLNVDFYY